MKAHIDFRITSLEVGRCGGILKRHSRTDGPFGCTHGVALDLFADTLGGLAVFTRLGREGRGILIKMETEYLKKAKGIIRIEKMEAYFRNCHWFCGI